MVGIRLGHLNSSSHLILSITFSVTISTFFFILQIKILTNRVVLEF